MFQQQIIMEDTALLLFTPIVTPLMYINDV